jgi:Arc/MetJ-type ribon-helix-helix transcriptional regulator
MPKRTKRSVSLPPDLAREIDRAATRSGTTFSGWLVETAAHRLRLDAGRRALAAWEREHGALTAEERAEGRAGARTLLGRSAARHTRRSA